ncbi:MAG: WG repeat-containing protein, partial [Abditibacteriota bacterium]|nr:WG repeat-containing protein [Abditibacteriota bacterium]
MKKLIFIVFCILLVSCAYAYIERSEYKCGIIDLTGKEIIQPKAGVYFETIGDSFCLTDKDGDKYGYCDITGKQITPIESDWPCYPINNLVAVNKNQKIGVYDLKGKLVFPFKYDITTWGTVTSYAPLKYNNVLCSYDDEVWALLNINGKKILPFEYEFIRGDCTQDLDIYLKAFKNDKVGYYNLDGSVIIPCEYDEIGEFHNKVASCKKGNKWCVKNLKGETLYGPTDKYDAIYPLNTNVYICKKNNIYSLVKDRKEIISGVKYCNIEELCKEKEFVDYICLKDND